MKQEFERPKSCYAVMSLFPMRLPGFAMFFCTWLLFLGLACREKKAPVHPASKNKADTIVKPVEKPRLPLPDTIRRIYLTFDDGPLNGTDAIIEALDKERLPATMFIVGKHVEMRADLKAKFELAYRDSFMQTGNHSYSHANRQYRLYYKHPEKVLEDFDRNQKLFHFRTMDARMPGRRSWRVGDRKKDDRSANGSEAADLLHASGYSIFGWDLEWLHSPETGKPIQSVDEMYKEIEKNIANPKKCFTPYHFVILAHDEMFQKPWEQTELKQLIDLLKASHYQFEPISKYPRQ